MPSTSRSCRATSAPARSRSAAPKPARCSRFGSTPTHVMTMAFDPDLDTCVMIALREMLGLIAARTGLTRQEAYALCSLAADLRVTQVVNGAKGIHVMLEKRFLGGRA